MISYFPAFLILLKISCILEDHLEIGTIEEKEDLDLVLDEALVDIQIKVVPSFPAVFNTESNQNVVDEIKKPLRSKSVKETEMKKPPVLTMPFRTDYPETLVLS
jgi:hypothetical protein